ncbi:MAG: hypothetical protein V4489_01845 [Chlamydiota bacterium]
MNLNSIKNQSVAGYLVKTEEDAKRIETLVSGDREVHIVVFGGTFGLATPDHIKMAEFGKKHLEEIGKQGFVLLLPTGEMTNTKNADGTDKKAPFSAEEREASLRREVRALDKVVVSCMETIQVDRCYTIETLEKIHAVMQSSFDKNVTFTVVLGEDTFTSICGLQKGADGKLLKGLDGKYVFGEKSSWHRGNDLVATKNIHLLCIQRYDNEEADLKGARLDSIKAFTAREQASKGIDNPVIYVDGETVGLKGHSSTAQRKEFAKVTQITHILAKKILGSTQIDPSTKILIEDLDGSSLPKDPFDLIAYVGDVLDAKKKTALDSDTHLDSVAGMLIRDISDRSKIRHLDVTILCDESTGQKAKEVFAKYQAIGYSSVKVIDTDLSDSLTGSETL